MQPVAQLAGSGLKMVSYETAAFVIPLSVCLVTFCSAAIHLTDSLGEVHATAAFPDRLVTDIGVGGSVGSKSHLCNSAI